jgi:hypothetical protein
VRSGLEHALNFMLGAQGNQSVVITTFEPFLMPIETYLEAYKKQSVLIRIYSDQDYKGELYWFFEMKTAILLGSMMRMVPANSVQEKLNRGELDPTEQDSFGEVGNQLSGILDRAFRSLTRKNIHLRMDFNKVVYPSTSIGPENFKRDEEFVVLLSSIQIPEHGAQKLTLLLPRSLYEVMLNLEVSLVDIVPKKVVFHSPAEAVAEKVQTELISRHVKAVRCDQPDDVLTLVDQPHVAAVGLEVKRPTFPLQHQDMIFFKRLASNRTFTRLPYFLTWEGATDDEVKEVAKLGLTGATTGSFADNFARWAKTFTDAPTG